MPPALSVRPEIVASTADLERVVVELQGVGTIAIDLESNGLHAYRAKTCVVQLAFQKEGATCVRIVDTLEANLSPLARVFADPDVVKVVHDLSFDARMLGESGLALVNVYDTSLAAHMLGRAATGLGALLSSELGVTIDKRMQHHDWARRPLDDAAVAYLAGDVIHLEALATKLWREVEAQGIVDEVSEEIRYRLAQAAESLHVVDTRRPYMRIKGIDDLPPVDLAVLRAIADVREAHARSLDVPPHNVLSPDVLLTLTKKKPRTIAELEGSRFGAVDARRRALAEAILDGIREGIAHGDVPSDERSALQRPTISVPEAKARRAREQKLTRWRKFEARNRNVNEQVVLPGHCLRALAGLTSPTLDDVRAIPGIGAFRVERAGSAMLAALASTEEVS